MGWCSFLPLRASSKAVSAGNEHRTVGIQCRTSVLSAAPVGTEVLGLCCVPPGAPGCARGWNSWGWVVMGVRDSTSGGICALPVPCSWGEECCTSCSLSSLGACAAPLHHPVQPHCIIPAASLLIPDFCYSRETCTAPKSSRRVGRW